MFANDLQKQVFTGLLDKVGSGAAAFYFDACSLRRLDRRFLATRMLVAHALRETRASIETRVASIGTLEQPAAEAFKELKNWQAKLHERAHRRWLELPNPIDDDFSADALKVDEAIARLLKLLPRNPSDAETEFLGCVERASATSAEAVLREEDARVLRNLMENVAPGPTAYFHDAIRLLDDDAKFLLTRSHLIAHVLREAESGLRYVLAPVGFAPDRSRSENNHLQQVRSILDAYDISRDDPVAQDWEAITAQDRNLAFRTHHGGLDSPRPLNDESRALYRSIIGVFDALLARFEYAFAKYLYRMDELVNSTTVDKETFLNKLPQTDAIYDYFFRRLADPTWIGELADTNVLNRPPEPWKNGDRVEYPAWPQGDYLRRMLEQAPQLAGEVWPFLEGATESRNPRVHEEIAKAAMYLPPNLRSDVAIAETKWLAEEGAFAWFRHAEALADLAVKLAEDWATDIALELLRALVQLDTVEVEGVKDLRLRTDRLALERILRDTVPILAVKGGLPALGIVGDTLATWRNVERPNLVPPNDLSFVWRPAIEEHEQNWKGDLQDAMIDALRDGANAIVSIDVSRLREVVAYFLGRPWNVERRIGIHLAAISDDADLASEVLARSGILDSDDCWHETQRLIDSHWANFSHASRSTVAAVILNTRDASGEPDLERQGRLTRRLPPPIPPELGVSMDAARTPGPDMLMTISGGTIEPKAPKSIDDLSLMEIDQILSFLREWQPRPIDYVSMTQDSPGALAENLCSLIAMRPAEYATAAERFIGIQPVYDKAVVAGFAQATERGGRFEWGTIPELLRWIAAQPRRANDHRASPDYDPKENWVFVRLAVLDLLEHSIRSNVQPTHRSLMGELLQDFARDPHPSPEDDQDYGGNTVERWFSNAMSAVRGRALQVLAVFGGAYAPDAMEIVKRVFEERVEHDESPSVRFAISHVFVRLLGLDGDWARGLVRRLFDGPLGVPAWAGYLYDGITPESAELLRPKYEQAVANLETAPDRSLIADWLANHLVLLYLHAELSLDDDLLVRFFANASTKLRHHFLWIAAQRLRESRGDEQFRERAMALWHSRVQSRASVDELSAFESWFDVGSLPDDWRLDQLALSGGRGVRFLGYMNLMNEDLPRLWPSDARRVILAARALTDAETDRVHIYGARKGLRNLIELAYATDDPNLRDEARHIANVVSARGLTDFKQFA